MQFQRRLVALAAWWLAAQETLVACPVCNSGRGQALRESVFDGGAFGINLGVALAPFLICAAVVYRMTSGPEEGNRQT